MIKISWPRKGNEYFHFSATSGFFLFTFLVYPTNHQEDVGSIQVDILEEQLDQKATCVHQLHFCTFLYTSERQ